MSEASAETSRRSRSGHCALCGRHTALTFHHLIPKSQHRKNWARKHFDRDTRQRGINICRLCHDGIHALLSEKDLARDYASLAALRRLPALQRHVQWVRKQK